MLCLAINQDGPEVSLGGDSLLGETHPSPAVELGLGHVVVGEPGAQADEHTELTLSAFLGFVPHCGCWVVACVTRVCIGAVADAHLLEEEWG